MLLDDPAIISCGRVVPAVTPAPQLPLGWFGRVFVRRPKPPSAPALTAGTTTPATGALAGDLAAPGAQLGAPLPGGLATATPPAARATTRLQSGAIVPLTTIAPSCLPPLPRHYQLTIIVCWLIHNGVPPWQRNFSRSLTTPGVWFLVHLAPTSSLASGFSSTSIMLMVCLLDTRLAGLSGVSLNSTTSTTMRHSVQLSIRPPSASFSALLPRALG